MNPVYLNVHTADVADLAVLDGKTFQVHLRPDGRLVLYLVEIAPTGPGRCPAILYGTGTACQCGSVIGHTGKHMWSNGD